MTDTYQDFADLVLHTRKNKDYEFRIRDAGADITIVAIHGGAIDPVTSALASEIAGSDCNLYDLYGLRDDCSQLRLPIPRYDEMRLNNLVRRSQTAISITGADGDAAIAHIGGRDRRMKDILRETLSSLGYDIAGPASRGAAHDPSRFFNRATHGGVQLELTTGLLESLVDCPLDDGAWEESANWNERFHAFVGAVREALTRWRAEAASDLDDAMSRFERATETFPASMRSSHHHHHH